MECYRIIVYVPESHVDVVKSAMFAAGAGRIGNYDCCCWQTRGEGQFRPLDGSSPFIGDTGHVESIPEFKLELISEIHCIDSVIEALKRSHPYETPAYQYWLVNY